MSKMRPATRLRRAVHRARRLRGRRSSSDPGHGGMAMRHVQNLLRNQQKRTTDPDTLHAEHVQAARVETGYQRDVLILTLSVLSFIVLSLSKRSSILRVEEILFAPIDRTASCDASTALRIVLTS